LFRSQIQEQQISIQSTITQMQALNSMIWGWVMAPSVSKTENKSSNSVNINMWWVNVNNGQDAGNLINKVKNALIQEAKRFNLWIS
jgi:hypothetical protein